MLKAHMAVAPYKFPGPPNQSPPSKNATKETHQNLPAVHLLGFQLRAGCGPLAKNIGGMHRAALSPWVFPSSWLGTPWSRLTASVLVDSGQHTGCPYHGTPLSNVPTLTQGYGSRSWEKAGNLIFDPAIIQSYH